MTRFALCLTRNRARFGAAMLLLSLVYVAALAVAENDKQISLGYVCLTLTFTLAGDVICARWGR